MSYSNQQPIITDETLSQVHSALSDAVSDGPILSLQQRFADYASSPHFAQFRSLLRPHVPAAAVNNREIAQAYDGLLMMEYCLQRDGVFVHHVRNVAPGKEMMCVSFVVPDYALFYSPDYHAYVGKLMMQEQTGKGKGEGEIAQIVVGHEGTPLFAPLSVFDQTPIDQLDIQLWAQQTLLKSMITPTLSLKRRVEGLLQVKLSPNGSNSGNNGNNSSDNGTTILNDSSVISVTDQDSDLSREPNQNTRGRESPVLQASDEEKIVQPKKKSKM